MISIARILGVPGGTLQPGAVADITVIDPEKSFIYSVEESFSKSRNSPFAGWQLQGKAVMTFMAGRITHSDQ